MTITTKLELDSGLCIRFLISLMLSRTLMHFRVVRSFRDQ